MQLPRAALLCALLLGSLPAIGQEALRIGQVDYDKAQVNLLAELLRRAYDRIGQPVTFVPSAARRSLARANNGELDGELVRIAGLDREYQNLVAVPVQLHVMRLQGYTLGPPQKVSGCADLKGLRVGIRMGIIAAEQCVRSAAVFPVQSYEDMLALLQSGQVDMVVVEDVFGIWLQRTYGRTSIHPLKKPLLQVPLVHYLNRRHAALVGPLAETLLRMTEDGSLEQLRSDYSMPFAPEILDLRQTMAAP